MDIERSKQMIKMLRENGYNIREISKALTNYNNYLPDCEAYRTKKGKFRWHATQVQRILKEMNLTSFYCKVKKIYCPFSSHNSKLIN